MTCIQQLLSNANMKKYEDRCFCCILHFNARQQNIRRKAAEENVSHFTPIEVNLLTIKPMSLLTTI